MKSALLQSQVFFFNNKKKSIHNKFIIYDHQSTMKLFYIYVSKTFLIFKNSVLLNKHPVCRLGFTSLLIRPTRHRGGGGGGGERRNGEGGRGEREKGSWRERAKDRGEETDGETEQCKRKARTSEEMVEGVGNS